MLTLLLIIIPFISALVLLLLKSNASKSLALGLSLVELALAVYAIWFVPTADLNYNCPWVPQMGIQMHLSMDGISALMVLLAAVLMPIIVYATEKEDVPIHMRLNSKQKFERISEQYPLLKELKEKLKLEIDY